MNDHQTDAVVVPSGTDAPPRRLTGKAAAKYLEEKYGLPVKDKTLRNWRALGRGPKCRYFGTTPIYDTPELDRYAELEALQDECPTSRTRRIAKQAAEQVAA